MAIKLSCPRCKTPLHVPTKLMGQYTQCPACQNRILIPPFVPAAGAEADRESGVSRTVVGGTDATVSIVAAAVTAAQPAARADASAVGKPQPAAASQSGAIPQPQQQPAQPAAVWSDRPAETAPARKVARFITSDSATTTVQLAADGELPQLQLTEGARANKAASGSGLNPLVLVGAACLSFCLCAALLLVDFDATTVDAQQEFHIRQQLEKHYKDQRGPLSPYQVHLREAEQARSRGDRAAEQRHYRHVLDLLHAERRDHRDRFRGLTGTPKSDQDLEELLARLLAGSSAEQSDESY